LARLDPASGRFSPVPGVAVGDRVFGFAFDGDDALWLQRLMGLERYERRGERWIRVDHVGAAEGVPNVEGSGLVVDRGGMVWLSSLRGLFRWDPQTRHLRRFGLADGLSSHEFVDRTLVLTTGGVLVSALADGGLVLLDTLAPDQAALRPSLVWDQVEVRRDGAWTALPTIAELALAPQDRELRVQLRLLAFDDVQANRYFTRLDGYDRDWVAQGASGERVFAGLAPGDYTLHARAVDAAGNPATLPPLRFSVQPPWWRTPWALAGCIAAGLLLLAWLAMEYRDRLKRRHAWLRAEHEREVTREASLAKTRFLATLGHEVRTPMTGVLGMSELLLGTPLDARQRGYTESIRGAGEHLLRLVNDALDLARIESGKLELNVQPFDLRALVADVVALMAPLAHQRGEFRRAEMAGFDSATLRMVIGLMNAARDRTHTPKEWMTAVEMTAAAGAT
jgi:signal transduction histidine kinase